MAPSSRLAFFCLRPAFLCLLLSCKSSPVNVQPEKVMNAKKAPTETDPGLVAHERRIAFSLVQMGETVATPAERAFLARLADPARTEAGAELEARARSMLSANFSDDERLLLLAQGEVGIAFDLLKSGHFAQARTLSRFVLDKDDLSPQLQRWALSAWTIAHSLEITRDLSADKPSAPMNFNALQQLHCKELCSTPGWKLVSLEDAGTLSRKGYSDRLLARVQFELAGATRPPWLTRVLDAESAATGSSAKAPVLADGPDGGDAQKESPQEPVSPGDTLLRRLARFTMLRQYSNAARDGERELARLGSGSTVRSAHNAKLSRETLLSEPCNGVFVHTLLARAQLSRQTQKRDDFLRRQEALVTELEKPDCTARALGLEEEDLAPFVTDARLWYARLLWEFSRTKEASTWASRALADAAAQGDWQLYFEAAQVLVGRIAFESETPSQLLAKLESVRSGFGGPEGEDFSTWSTTRLGLIQFLDGRYKLAEKTFDGLFQANDSPAVRAQALYWRGRAQYALGQTKVAEESLRRAGAEDPLSYYDVLAGRRLSSPSSLASTEMKSPFDRPWSEIQERWTRLRVGRPFALFRPELWFGEDSPPGTSWTEAASATPRRESDETRAHRRAFENSISASLLLATSLRAGLGLATFELYTAHLRDSGSFYSRLLRSEALWSQQAYIAFHGQGERHLPSAVRIAWLLHVIGESKTAIPFVALFKNDFLHQEEDLTFLYFIFYPRPYSSAFAEAARVCQVDINLLYAVARQESLFQANAASPAGAFGLMQLLPATAARVLHKIPGHENETVDKHTLLDPKQNTLAGACYLKELLARYKGNTTHAVSAYNAGEALVDQWIAKRNPLDDDTYFAEWIPFQETREYVERVQRNDANLRWIYGPG